MPEDPPSFVNAGTLTPGSVVNGFNVRGTFAQTETGVLVIEVDGFDAGGFHGGEGEMQHGVLRVEEECCGGVLATTQLAGELRFDFDESLVPQLGDDVRFLRGDVAGVFDTVAGLPSLADGLAWTLLYGPTGASAVVTIAGDFNADGVVDAADYTVWRDGLGVTHTQADYAAWEANFGATADAFVATAATPEPTTFLLVACAVAARATRHRRC